MKRFILYVVCVAFALLLLTPALASATTSTANQIAQLQRAVAALQVLTAQQGQQIQALQTQVAAKHAILTGSGAPAASLGAIGDLYVNTATYQIYGPKTRTGWVSSTSLIGPKGAAGATGAMGSQGPKGDTGPDVSQEPAYAGLFALAPYVSVTIDTLNGVIGPNVIFQGVNVHVRSTSSTIDRSGLGNLIVGWDEMSPPRTGCNNIVCGYGNSFTAAGGLVAGFQNTINADWSTVTGGVLNTATSANAYNPGGGVSGGASTVSGGLHNTAFGNYSSVSGGEYNTASGLCASVGGGYQLSLDAQHGWAAGTPGATPASPFQQPWFLALP